MAKVSSGLSLSTNYFMRNYYANNRDVIKTSGRNDYTKIELSFEDSRALTSYIYAKARMQGLKP